MENLNWLDELTTLLENSVVSRGVEKVVVGAVIIRDSKVLVVRRVSDDFMGGLVEIPSGGVDEGEDLISALRREVSEETGLLITSVDAYIGAFSYTSGSGKKARQFCFLVKASGDVKLNPAEHDEYTWANPRELDELNLSKETENCILKGGMLSEYVL